jgi:hypothetical protein
MLVPQSIGKRCNYSGRHDTEYEVHRSNHYTMTRRVPFTGICHRFCRRGNLDRRSLMPVIEPEQRQLRYSKVSSNHARDHNRSRLRPGNKGRSRTWLNLFDIRAFAVTGNWSRWRGFDEKPLRRLACRNRSTALPRFCEAIAKAPVGEEKANICR